MTDVSLPLTTYQVKSGKPAKRFGSPANLRVRSNRAEVYARVPIQKIPLDAVITEATVRIYTRGTNNTGTRTLQVRNITETWKSGINWNKRPSIGGVLGSQSKSGPPARTAYDIDVTSWAQTRSPFGLAFLTGHNVGIFLKGSSAGRDKPVLRVSYFIPAEQSGGLRPDGGSVSVPKPVLTYVGEDDMTAQKIQYSVDEGGTIAYDTGWLPAVEGRYVPGAGAPSLTNGGDGIYWRVRTQSPDGDSDWSDWAYYEYDALPLVTVTNPPATTNDGSPPLQWTVSSQSAWRARFFDGAVLLDDSGWRAEAATRSWTPSRNVKVPGGTGRFELFVRDAVVPRVGTDGGGTETHVVQQFNTVLAGSGASVNSLTVSMDDPTPMLTGHRTLGTPDEIALYRDGVQVPLWNDDGDPVGWAPGTQFFSGSAFSIPDFTASPGVEHTWRLQTRTNGTTLSGQSAPATGRVLTESIWLLDPSTGEKVEVVGLNGLPEVAQTAAEDSILHLPLNGGVRAEQIRRRVVRATKSGSVVGAIKVEDEETVVGWSEADSGRVYRLIFGRVNWPVIMGDYVFANTVYEHRCAPNYTSLSLNWWQRISDF